MSLSGYKIELFKAIVGGIVGIVVGITVGIVLAYFTYAWGLKTGEERTGTNPEFKNIATQLKLNGTKWAVSYEDATVSGPVPQSTPPPKADVKKPASQIAMPTPRLANVQFTQVGSRIVGQGYDLTGRTWIIEGAAAERRLCYIYYDSGGQRLSFGTVLLEINNAGTEMSGQWVGWSPESNELKLRKVTLTRI